MKVEWASSRWGLDPHNRLDQKTSPVVAGTHSRKPTRTSLSPSASVLLNDPARRPTSPVINQGNMERTNTAQRIIQKFCVSQQQIRENDLLNPIVLVSNHASQPVSHKASSRTFKKQNPTTKVLHHVGRHISRLAVGVFKPQVCTP